MLLFVCLWSALANLESRIMSNLKEVERSLVDQQRKTAALRFLTFWPNLGPDLGCQVESRQVKLNFKMSRNDTAAQLQRPVHYATAMGDAHLNGLRARVSYLI